MYESIDNFATLLAALALLLWAIAGYRAGRLVYRPTQGKLRSSARRNLALLSAGGLAIVGNLAVVGMLWSLGWVFARDRVIVQLPLLVIPAASVFILSVPRLWKMERIEISDPKRAMDSSYRAKASDPRFVIPVQATAIGALLSFYAVFWARPVPPFVGDILPLAALLVIATALLWLRQSRRQRSLSRVKGRVDFGIGLRVLRVVSILAVIALVGAGVFTYEARASQFPEKITNYPNVEYGGGPVEARGVVHASSDPDTSVAELTGPRTGTPDEQFTLTAEANHIRLGSGKITDAWTFNGQDPGPTLVAHEGDLVQVKLVNKLSKSVTLRLHGVTLHWHGYNVPNAEDGVAGITQDAVPPGHTYTYRFRAEQVGTFWYHSHQRSAEQVPRGLFGAFIVLPRAWPEGVRDITVMPHTWQTRNGKTFAFGVSDILRHEAVEPGTPVRLRLVNTDIQPVMFDLSGTPFEVAAIDGHDLNQPGALTHTRLELGAGGRYDLTFTMPDNPVLLSGVETAGDGSHTPETKPVGLLLSPDGTGTANPWVPTTGPLFDPARYGRPTSTPFGLTSRFDRQFTMTLGDGPGWYNGKFGLHSKIDGESFPNIPVLMVHRGDLVKITYINTSHNDHPMHLHGHHVLVLSRNGHPVAGSPWWVDTLNVAPGEMYEVAFRADNPGIWNFHCHNLGHAADGMVTRLVYEGVSTPYHIGPATGNKPA